MNIKDIALEHDDLELYKLACELEEKNIVLETKEEDTGNQNV